MKNLIEVRPGERSRTFLMFCYFFLVIAIIYILKPVRSALFLESLGAKNLRYVYIGEGFFLIFVVAAYIQFAKRVSHRVFYPAVLAFFMSHLVIFWFLFRLQVPYLAAFFYVWVASFSIAMTTQFWTLANDIFNSMEAKRLFGLIASGGSLGGVIGGLMTSAAVRWVKTEDLLLVAACVVAACIAVVISLQKELALSAGHKAPPASSAAHADEESRPVWKIFSGSSYLCMLTALVMIAKIASAVVDNQFSRMVELSVIETEARTAFFGSFMAWLNTASWLMQLVMTGICLRFLGVSRSLWILPVGLFLTSGASLLFPVLASAIALKALDGSVNYSIQQASKEMLFLPLSSALRYRVKPVIDMLGFRAAKSLGGVYILAAAPLLGIKDEDLGLLVLLLIPAWFFLVWRMKKGYSKLLRRHVLAAGAPAAAAEKPAGDMLPALKKADSAVSEDSLRHSSPLIRKMAAIALRSGSAAHEKDQAFHRAEEEFHNAEHPFLPDSLSPVEIRMLEQYMMSPLQTGALSAEARSQFDRLEQDWQKLAGKVQDPHSSLTDKRCAIGLLGRMRSAKVADFLRKELSLSQSGFLRASFIEALGLMRANGLTMNRLRLRDEIRREAGWYADLMRSAGAAEHAGENQPCQNLKVLLGALAQETLQRIFNLLSLLYAPEEMRMMYELIIRHSAQDAVHSHVLELLGSMIDPDLFAPVQSALDSRRAAVSAGDLKALAEKWRQFPDSWMVLAGRWMEECQSPASAAARATPEGSLAGGSRFA